MSLPGRLIEIGGARLFVHEAAPAPGAPTTAAPPVVLVHGWLLSHYAWRHLIPLLTRAGHRVIAIDLPGYGESDRSMSFRYDVTAQADALLGALDVLGVPRAQLIGHGMGGAVALVAAARRPERITRLGLIAAAVYPFELPAEGRAALLPVVGQFFLRAAFARKVMRSFLRREVYKDPSLVTDAWVDYLWERANRPGSVEAAHASLEDLTHPDLVASAVRAVRAPAVVVWGADDRLLPADHARRLAADLGGAEAHIIPYCGHAPAEERPEALAEVLLPFLAAGAGAAAGTTTTATKTPSGAQVA